MMSPAVLERNSLFARYSLVLWDIFNGFLTRWFVFHIQQGSVELEIIQQARMTLAKSPPGTTVGG